MRRSSWLLAKVLLVLGGGVRGPLLLVWEGRHDPPPGPGKKYFTI